MSGSYWRQLQAAPHPRGARLQGGSKCAILITRLHAAQPARQRPDDGRVRSRARRHRDRRLRRPRRSLRLDLAARSTPSRPRSRPRQPRAARPASSSVRRERRRIGASLCFPVRAYCAGDGRELHLTYLNRPDVEALALTDDEILDAVEGGLRAQGLGETVIEPRVHLRPDEAFRGHFNVLRGYIAPLGAGRRQGRRRLRRQLPARPAVGERPADAVRPAHGRAAGRDRRRRPHRHAHGRGHGARRAPPRARRTRACSGTSARAARPTGTCACSRTSSSSRRSACIRGGPRAARPSARSSSATSARPVRVCDDWESVVRGADIVVEAARLERPEPLLRTEWIEPGRAGRALRHDERRRALADRHHGQARRRRLGPVPQRPVRLAARARRGGHALGGDAARRAGRDRRRRASPGASATTRRSSSGTAASA